MGKPKKGKKARQDDEFGDDDDADFDPSAPQKEVDDEIAVKQPAGKKGKKGKKKKDDDWEDVVASEVAGMSIKEDEDEVVNGQDVQPKQKKKDKKKNKKQVQSDSETEDLANLDVSDDEIIQMTTKPKGKKKASGMTAFAMLDMDDDNDSVEESQSDDDKGSPERKEDQQAISQKEKKGKKDSKKTNEEEDVDATLADLEESQAKPLSKKDKKKKKKKEEDEEDIEAIMAELRGEVEPVEKEKKKKKKKQKPEEMDYEVEQGGIDFQDMSSMTQEEIAKALEGEEDEEEDRKKKKKGKKGKAAKKEDEEDLDAILAELDGKPKEEKTEDAEDEEADEGGTVKTAAQKKKEKRDRQKQKKLEEAKKGKGKKADEKEATPESEKDKTAEASAAAAPDEAAETKEDDEEEEADSKKKKKKDKKKKKGEEEKEEKKKKPSKMAQAILEQQRKVREEEDRLLKEEEERIRIEDEAIKESEEKDRAEREKRESKKQKKKQKMEQKKAEGTYLTPKQKEQQLRAQQMLKALGHEVPQSSEGAAEPEKKKRVVYTNKKKKPQMQKQESTEAKPEAPVEKEEPEKVEIKVEEEEKKKEDDAPKESWEDEDDVKDAWDAESEEEKEEEKKEETQEKEKAKQKAVQKKAEVAAEKEEESEEEEDSEEGDESEEESSSEESSSEEESSDDDLTLAEKARLKAENRIQKRKELAEKSKDINKLRCPVVCVLGHVDTGKTKILDKLRRTNVQDGEAGGITQQIGATNVPHEAIIEKTKMCKEFAKQELKVPGLLIIDTPGHESFSNLRSRGSSLCDIAILVVDIMHGLEPQTIESIGLLKKRKTPFIVALNKVDRLYGWQSNPHTDIVNTLKKQKPNTKQEFEERTTDIIVQFAEQGLNACLFFENKNPKEYISFVPTSAHSGDGMGNLVALVCELTQTYLAKKLAFSEELHATVMEVKAITGLGTTIDVILVNGRIKEGQTIVVPGTEGPIVTQIRALLMPEPMKELRVKSAYNHFKEVVAAQGVKIIAKDLDNAIAGLPLHIAYFPDEVDIYKEELEEVLEEFLKSIRVQEKGVFVQASTLGSLEALLSFLKDSKIPYSGINIGPVHRRDVMKISAMLEREDQYAVILAFDVKVEREAQEMADSLGIRVFTAEIIYHLFDQFTAYIADYKKKKQEEFKHLAIFPCKLRVLPQYIFNSRDPIVMGVIVEAGFIKCGQPICVPSKEFLHIGIVTSLELNHKNVDKGTVGQEICIKIDPTPGDSPKMYGRHFEHTDILMSKISRESIDALKNWFRDEMTRADWQLVMEMKKIFEII